MPANGEMFSKEEVEERKKAVKDTLCCPHCDDRLQKWLVPQTLFTQWPNEFMYICFNDECPYYVRNQEAMLRLGNTGSQRLMYDPEQDCCQPIPVMSANSLRDGSVEEDESKTGSGPQKKGFISSILSKFRRKGDD